MEEEKIDSVWEPGFPKCSQETKGYSGDRKTGVWEEDS